MREIAVQHVEREHAPIRGTLGPENEFCFRIDELANEPGRADTIDLGSRPSEPDSAAKMSRVELGLGFRCGLSSVQVLQNRVEILGFGTIKKIGFSDLAKLFSNAIKFALQF